MELSVAQLLRVCPYASQRHCQRYLPHVNAALPEAQVNTPLRAAMFLAQVAHETGGLVFFLELWGPTEAQARYEPPSTLAAHLGNTEPGDGFRFRGRGAIQLTGRANYAAASRELGVDLVADPDLAATPEQAFRIAAWFWRKHNLNVPSDLGDVEAATRVINGGTNGLLDRHMRYDAACEALGVLNVPIV